MESLDVSLTFTLATPHRVARMAASSAAALGRALARVTAPASSRSLARACRRVRRRVSPARAAGARLAILEPLARPRALSTLARASGKVPMFDYTALVASTAEINALATPAKIDSCAQLDPHSLILNARAADGRVAVRVSWHPTTAHVALSASAPRAEKSENLSFGEVTNATLRGKVLLDASCGTPFERACRLSFGERPGGDVEYELVCEVMGAQSNAFLVDATREGTVVACGYQPGEGRAGARRLATGRAYSAPPTAPGLDPPVGAREGIRGWVDIIRGVANGREEGERSRVDACVVRAFRGVSPALARALARGANVPDGAVVGDMTDEAWSALYDEFNRWIESVRDGAVSLDSARWCEEFGQLLLHSSVVGAPLPPRADDLSVAGGPIGALFGAVYGEAGDKDVFDRERSRILQAVRSRLKKLASKEAGFYKQLEAASGHEKIQEHADALMAYAYSYVAGSSELEGQDFTTGEPTKYAVDPEKGPVATAEALYKKTRKLRRTADAVEPLIEENEREMEYLQQVEFSIAEVSEYGSRDDLLFIEEIGAELEDGGFLKPTGKGAEAKIRAAKDGGKKGGKPKTGKAARKQEMMSAIRVYVAPSGKEVYCGRNSRGNEAVSLHFGKEHDVWFHVRGAPGAHVILRQQPGDKASDEDMQFAANVAAFHSKARAGGKVDVSYASPRHVRKPAGARLGMVTLERESVMIARPDDVTDVCERSE